MGSCAERAASAWICQEQKDLMAKLARKGFKTHSSMPEASTIATGASALNLKLEEPTQRLRKRSIYTVQIF